MHTSNAAAGIGESPSPADLLSRSTKRSPYFAKDLAKARQATQFTGQGSPGSSTAAYARAAAPRANTGHYVAGDVVFVSAEGNRTGWFDPIGQAPNGAYRAIDRAIAARARFVIDRPADRNRPYNIGERQVAAYLEAQGYEEAAPGHFVPARSWPLRRSADAPAARPPKGGGGREAAPDAARPKELRLPR